MRWQAVAGFFNFRDLARRNMRNLLVLGDPMKIVRAVTWCGMVRNKLACPKSSHQKLPLAVSLSVCGGMGSALISHTSGLPPNWDCHGPASHKSCFSAIYVYIYTIYIYLPFHCGACKDLSYSISMSSTCTTITVSFKSPPWTSKVKFQDAHLERQCWRILAPSRSGCI